MSREYLHRNNQFVWYFQQPELQRLLMVKKYLASEKAPKSEEGLDAPILEMRFDFGYRLARAINRVAVVTPFALTGSAILATARRGFTVNDLKNTAELFYDYLSWRKVNFVGSIAEREQLDTALRLTLQRYASEKQIKQVKVKKELVVDEGEQLYAVDDELRLNLEYYKNNILHYMLPIAFTSSAILASNKLTNSYEELLKDFYILRNLLNYDFIFPVEDKSKKHLQESLDYLKKMGFVSKSDDNYTLLPRHRQTLGLFAGLIYNFFETYFVVAKSLKNLEKQRLHTDEFMSEVQKTGLIFYHKGVITRPEALSKINYQGAINYFLSKGIIIEETEPPAKEGKKPDVYYTLTKKRQSLNWRRLKRFRQINV